MTTSVEARMRKKKKKKSKQHDVTLAGRDKLGEVRVNENSVGLTSPLARELQLSGVNRHRRSRCCRQISRLIYLKHQRRALGRARGESTPTTRAAASPGGWKRNLVTSFQEQRSFYNNKIPIAELRTNKKDIDNLALKDDSFFAIRQNWGISVVTISVSKFGKTFKPRICH